MKNNFTPPLRIFALILLLASLLLGVNVAKAQVITATLSTDAERVIDDTSASNFTVTLTFSEDVTGLAVGNSISAALTLADQIATTNANPSALSRINSSASKYRFVVVPNGIITLTVGDIITVTFNAGVGTATDESGRTNTVSNTLEIPFGPAPLTIESFASPTSVIGLDHFNVVVTFSEPVKLVVTGSFDVDNGSAIRVTGNFSDTITVTIEPDGGGDIEISVLANQAAKLMESTGNIASEVHTVTYVAPPLTVELEGPASGYVNSMDLLTIGVRFSEDIQDLSTGSSSSIRPTIRNYFTVSGATINGLTKVTNQFYRLSVFPTGSDISFTFKVGQATTLSSIVNIAASPTLPIRFGTPPPVTVEPFTGPERVLTLEPFDVTITFSEVVTFISSASSNFDDIFDVSNGSVTGFETTNGSSTGTSLSSKASLGSTTHLSSKAFKLSITPDGNGDIKAAILPNSFTDSTDRPNARIELFTVRFDLALDTDTAATKAAITDFMLNRSNQLASNQPGLSRFLQADGCSDVAANGSDTSGNVAACASTKHAWGDINSSWSDDDSYTLISLGGHGFVGDNTIIGGMVQYDIADDDTPNITPNVTGNITGKGWLAGPYFVHKQTGQNVTFEGRLLYGQTDNDISPLGTYTDSFDTKRYLAQLRITGEYGYQTATLMPLVDFTYTEDTQDAYTNTPDDLIEEQNTDLTQMTFGLDFKLPLAVQRGSLDFTGGISGIYSETGGGVGGNGEPTFEGARARTELGLNYGSEDGPIVRAGTFYDGISTDYESYGLSISVGKEF